MRRFCDNAIQDFFQRVDSFPRDRVFVVHQMHLVGIAQFCSTLNDNSFLHSPKERKNEMRIEIGRLWLEEQDRQLATATKKFPRAAEAQKMDFGISSANKRTSYINLFFFLISASSSLNKRGLSSCVNAFSDVTFMTFISCRPAAQRK